MKHLFRAVLATALLALSLHAQSRNEPGFVIDAGTHPLSTLAAPQSVELQAPSIPIAFPRWSGRDDAGNAYPWNYLRGVQVSVRFDMQVNAAGENASGPVGLWQVEVGARSQFSRGSYSFGGGSFTSYVAAGTSLGAFDGDADGQGASGWSSQSGGTPIVSEFAHVGVNREDLRRWCGDGMLVLDWQPTQATIEHGFPGHWREWSTATVRVIEVQVRYVLGAPLFPGVYRVEEGPWVDYGMLRLGESAELDVADPAPQAFAQWFEYAEESGRWVGIENMAPFTATCGGSGSGGVRIERGDVLLPGLYSNSGAGVGSFAPVGAFDGSCDWHGVSGRETFSGASWTNVWRSQVEPPSLEPVRVRARVGHAAMHPESLTPGATFAWDGSWRFSGRVRVARAVAP